MVGLAVGDALGAPFEFGLPGGFSRRFPTRDAALRDGMCGGGGWEPGEATDDTQMALHVGLSLAAHGGLEPADVFRRFRSWAADEPKDIGLQAEVVLTSGLPWDEAAEDYLAHHHLAAGNGSLMRAVTGAVFFAGEGTTASTSAARALSALTHADPATGEGCVVFHELVRVALGGGDPLAALPAALALVDEAERARWAVVLAPDWHPDDATEFNGAVWPALGSAVWALRSTPTFADAVCAAVDLGGDTDTVAAVTGALAGAVYGLDAIPEAWRDAVHVPLPGADRAEEYGPWRCADLTALAQRLAQAAGGPS
ncbi:ADP-ribosylglycohydrolase family protein [Yinghuangia sp. KLBMP8922]|uniref:ADP-ribosylglycohydrolase family protein n=1 Tax=Yinghuangia soli TaxID=2908204 RepID=A0AA41U007_9ACTN|nr:ADP-ribosylglycohydrolase family protein [Yinghuangia soli]MCF2525932.1 ADP-ribosylglycohydrolase family protein [Yinghuangia soli]